MFQFCGYDFYLDGNCLQNAPTSIVNLNQIKLTNAIFDHANVTTETDEIFSTVEPIDWNYNTILNADFAGNLDAGNIEMALSKITAIRIQYRKKGDFEWTILKEIPIENYEDLIFTMYSRYNANNTEYDFAFVPMSNGIPGEPIIKSIVSKFNGIFISDADTTYKLFFETTYGPEVRVRQVGTFNPLGKKYPILVANGAVNYTSGSAAALALDDDYEKTRIIDGERNNKRKTSIIDFLTNNKAKILKDQNGNIWLVGITDAIQTEYAERSDMTVPRISFGWQETGDSNSQEDLYSHGLIPALE